MRLIEKLFNHSYITLKQQSLDKIAIFGGFSRKSMFQGLALSKSATGYPAAPIEVWAARERKDLPFQKLFPF